jgi:glycosyltransferase involved in cell wall biosynthesis
LKIACISPSRVPSRTANSMQAMKTCHALAQIGNEVRLYLPGNESTRWEDLRDHYGLQKEFEITWLKSRSPLRRYDFSFTAVRNAQKWDSDIIYTWLPQAGLFALQRKIPAILEMHDRVQGKLGPWVFARFCRHAGPKRLAVITQALREILERETGIHLADKEVVITPNGVEWERFALDKGPQQARKDLGFPDRPTAAFSGHFYPGRGTGLLFALAQALPEMQFIWIGGRQEDIEFWRIKLSSVNVTNVILTGFVENIRLPEYLAAADVLLIPFERRIEGSSGGNSADICSPMKLFEYMAAGRAILTSDLPVIHEVLNDTNACFAPPDDLAAWKTKLRSLYSDPERIRALSKKAREDARQYAWVRREEKALEGFPF